jgi:hypothetical protein
MNITLLPNRSRPRLFPRPASWLKALCLLPLAMPGVKVVLSGFSWYDWLNFPFGWIPATVIMLLMHVVLPLLIVAGIYWGVRSMWSTRSTVSQVAWFAASTVAVIVLSFGITVGIAALAELTICRLPVAISLLGGSCSNHFVNSDLGDLVSSMETYNFRYYTWIVWFVCMAYCYHLEAFLHQHNQPQVLDNYSEYGEDLESSPSTFAHENSGLDVPRSIIDADVLDGSAHS